MISSDSSAYKIPRIGKENGKSREGNSQMDTQFFVITVKLCKYHAHISGYRLIISNSVTTRAYY